MGFSFVLSDRSDADPIVKYEQYLHILTDPTAPINPPQRLLDFNSSAIPRGTTKHDESTWNLVHETENCLF